MAKILQSATGATIVIASNDHCPPHVHAWHRSEGWIVRLAFSFATNTASVLSIAPTSNAVRQRQLNEMLDEISAHTPQCRAAWWSAMATTCLENKWAIATSGRDLQWLEERQPAAQQVLTATYRPLENRTIVIFKDGSKMILTDGAAA